MSWSYKVEEVGDGTCDGRYNCEAFNNDDYDCPWIDEDTGFDLWNYDVAADAADDDSITLYSSSALTVTCEDCYVGIRDDGHILVDLETSTWAGVTKVIGSFSATLVASIFLELVLEYSSSKSTSKELLSNTCIPGICYGGKVLGVSLSFGLFAGVDFETTRSVSGDLTITAGASMEFEVSLDMTATKSGFYTDAESDLQFDTATPSIDGGASASFEAALVPSLNLGFEASAFVGELQAYVTATYTLFLDLAADAGNSIGLPDDSLCNPWVALGDCDSGHDLRLSAQVGTEAVVGYTLGYDIAVIGDYLKTDEYTINKLSLGPYQVLSYCACLSSSCAASTGCVGGSGSGSGSGSSTSSSCTNIYAVDLNMCPADVDIERCDSVDR